MSTLEASRAWTIVDDHPYTEPAGAADDESLATSARQRDENRQGWQDIIDSKLIEWGRDPGQLEDEDVTPPSRAIIDRASDLAMLLRERNWHPPNRVVPSGDGGIIFERWDGPIFEQIEISDDGAVLVASFEDSRLVSTTRLV